MLGGGVVDMWVLFSFFVFTNFLPNGTCVALSKENLNFESFVPWLSYGY